MKRFIIKYLIPKWYKRKYSDMIGNRKYASGYWFEFIIPRCIVPYHYTNNKCIYRWLNFFYERK